MTVDLATEQEIDNQQGSGPNGAYTGPRVREKIVGVIGSPWFLDGPGGSGFGFVARRGDQVSAEHDR